jgi:hypothetical protein
VDDDGFDRLVAAAGATTAVRQEALDRLVEQAGARRRRGRRRGPVVLGAAVAGALLLAAAATSTWWAHVPPFQSLEDGMYRSKAAIPVDFTTTGDLQVRCRAFLEYTGLSVHQSQQVEAYVEGHDWSGLGQRLYDRDAPAHESYEHAQDRVAAALDPVLAQAAAAAVPGVHPSGFHGAGARVNGWSFDCRRAAR